MTAARRSLAVVATSFNRRAQTVDALRRAVAAASSAGLEARVVLVDAGSRDGTGAAVARGVDGAVVLDVSSDHYWTQGMRVGVLHALSEHPDLVLWLNDDASLERGAISTMVGVLDDADPGALVVGAMRDPVTGEPTYGGWRRTRRWGLRLEPVEVSAQVVECDTMNGNAVLMSAGTARTFGVPDTAFRHALGDFDCGLRASSAGCRVLQAPGTVGRCSRNAPGGSWRDLSLARRERVQLMLGPKGLPPKDWAVYQLRHAGLEAPLNMARPWLRVLRPRQRSRTAAS